MLRVVVPCVALVAALVQATGAAGAITLNPGADTVSTSRFELAFGPPNVERLDTVRWRDSGGNLSANLALNSGTGCGGGDPADQWGRADSIAGMPAPVGSGSAGTWGPRATRTVQVDSSRPPLCTGDTTVTPIRTRYTFFDSGAAASKVRVERRFSFSAATPDYQSASFRAYVPELPVNPYSQVIHPNQAGGALVTDQASNPPDTTSNWNGTWLALNDPVTGRGMLILRDPATPNPARIALESAGGANSSSVDLLKPAAGWKAPVTETEFLCFYDQTSWPPNQRSPSSLPAGCSVATVPVLNTQPGISGDPRAGTQLDGDAGSWDSAASFAYQWLRCSGGGCTPIAGATGTSYTPTSDDEGKQLRLDVTATATGGESDAASSGLTDGVKPGPPSVPRNVGAPQVTGEARDGETLTGSNGNWAGGVTSFSYQWLRCATASGGNCVPVPGATSNTYKQVRDDVGSTMRLRVRATNGAGTSDPTDSAPTAIVQPQVLRAAMSISPNPSCTGVPTTFDGSASRTPNGPIVRYRYTYKELPALVFLGALFDPDFVVNFLAQQPSIVLADSANPAPDATFNWNRQLTAAESYGRKGDYARDLIAVTLTVTDASGATATTGDLVAFTQGFSNQSRANCPKPSPFRKFAFAKVARVVFSGSKATAVLPCAASYACAGRLTLFQTVRGGAAARRARRTTLASSKFFSIPAGQRKSVTAKLARAGRRLVRGKRRVRASLQVASVDPLGKTTTRTFGVRISSRRRGGR
jgi:hypothetical protein